MINKSPEIVSPERVLNKLHVRFRLWNRIIVTRTLAKVFSLILANLTRPFAKCSEDCLSGVSRYIGCCAEVEVLLMFFCWMCQSLGLPFAASLAGLKTANKFTSPSRRRETCLSDQRLHYLRLLVPDNMARANLSSLSSVAPLYLVQANLRIASFLPLEL